MKTRSLWGSPPTRFYNFLRRVETEFLGEKLRFCILGCADGKFVLPLARKGYEVLAIDIDDIAINGGIKAGVDGDVYMPGLISRLEAEGVSKLVSVVNTDFMHHVTSKKYHGVFTSGAINYSYNLRHPIGQILTKVKSYVKTGGFLYFDYMLPMESEHYGRENYFIKGQLEEYFKTPEWEVIYDRVLPPLKERAHVDKPVDHYHHWGHLLVKKL